jgi:hypothetical protein
VNGSVSERIATVNRLRGLMLEFDVVQQWKASTARS